MSSYLEPGLEAGHGIRSIIYWKGAITMFSHNAYRYGREFILHLLR
jgi:hypothetical protein